MRCNGKGNEKGLEWKGLVVWTSEKKVDFRIGNGAGEKRNYGCVGYMERGVDGKDIRRVFLETAY